MQTSKEAEANHHAQTEEAAVQTMEAVRWRIGLRSHSLLPHAYKRRSELSGISELRLACQIPGSSFARFEFSS